MPERLLVIGGDAAGMSAASQARRRRGPDDLEIVAFERGDYTSYSACGIPYLIGGVVPNAERLIVRTPKVFRERQSIDVRMHQEVVEIDLDRRSIKARSTGDGDDSWEGFDELLIATGGIPRRPPLENSDPQGIFGVQTLNDGLTVRAFLDQREPKKAVIVGAGYIGLEMAEALISQGLEVILIDQRAQPMSTFDPDMGEVIRHALTGMGIQVHTEESVIAFETRSGEVSAVVTSHRTVPTDMVVLGLGTAPNTGLAIAAGVGIGPSGAIGVDPHMRTDVAGLWAAGDCAEKFHRVSRKGVSIALGTHANKEGRVAGINLGGGEATFPGVLGTATSKVCGLELARTGLNESEAADAGFDYRSTTIDSTTRAGYYPGAGDIKTKLVFEKGSGRLLGGQIIGKEGAAKRIDVIATALWNEMSVEEMVSLDLSYAPPFSPVWDPVLIAARKAVQLV
ncbi:MAG: FAD-dependent oxidoreductase [Actinomycetota bacterium]|nr:FAD-dependent oxidoreductase [Actinomycetota bacterium]